MRRKINEQNERMKHRFAVWRREARRADMKTVDKELEAILRFERSTGFRAFKLFRIDQAVQFKRQLEEARTPRTQRPLAKATIDSILRSVKTFFLWLADQPNYRSKVKYSDVEYFNLNAKDARVAHAKRDVAFPTIEQCRHTFSQMPDATLIDRRNRAIFALFMLTAARIGAVSSLCLKHVDLVDRCIHQDAREVSTKGSKTFTTWFFPVDDVYFDELKRWIAFLRAERLFGPADALFPRPTMGQIDGAFAVAGLSRETYANAGPLRAVIGNAFAHAGLPRFHPHSFRKTLVILGNAICSSPEEFKAWSQNLGHDSVVTTMAAYLPVSSARQRELIRAITRADQRN